MYIYILYRNYRKGTKTNKDSSILPSFHPSILHPSSFIHPSSIYPAIHYLYHFSFESHRGSWSQSQLTLGERRGSPWTGRQCFTGPTYRDKQPFTLTFTPTVNLESPMNLTLTCMSLDCGRKPEYPDKSHADMEWTCNTEKPHSEPGFEPTASGAQSKMSRNKL